MDFDLIYIHIIIFHILISKVHATFSHNELGKNYQKAENLLAAPELFEYIKNRRVYIEKYKH